MNVLVIEPGHGSVWLTDARYDGERVVGFAWDDDNSALVRDGGISMPTTLNYPRNWVLKVEGAAADVEPEEPR